MLIKKDKINFIVCAGLSLIAVALIFWVFTIMAIRDQEIMLASQDLGVSVHLHKEALSRLKNAYVTTIIPVTNILSISGLATIVISQLPGLVQKVALRTSRLNIVEEKTVSRWDNNVKEEPVAVLQDLISEEDNLKEEKEKLESFNEKWKLKVKKAIESKQSNIRKLRAEIDDLKSMREELSKFSKIG